MGTFCATLRHGAAHAARSPELPWAGCVKRCGSLAALCALRRVPRMASWFSGWEPETEPEPEPEATAESERDPKSERSSAALAALREALADTDQAQLHAALPGLDDFTLLRFLIAREFDVSAAAAMVTERVKWAEEVGLDGIMAEWRGGEGGKPTTARSRAADQIFYAGLLGTSASGAPLMVERLGKADLAGVNREGEELLQLLLKSYIAYLETVFRALTAESVQQQVLVRSLCLVDAAGVDSSTLWHINVVKAVAAIGPAYYPEMTERVLILQAPWVVAKLWAMLQPLLPAHTQSKVSIVEATPEATAAALEGVLDLAAAQAFIEGGGAAVASDLCPTALVPEGIMQQLEQPDQEASQPGVDDRVEMAPSS
eukprot:COSAG02_NODE_4262_length_5575_cov_7.055698_2_plen_372_part_00